MEYLGALFCLLAASWGFFLWKRLQLDLQRLHAESENIERLLDECCLVRNELEQLLKELSNLAEQTVTRLEREYQKSKEPLAGGEESSGLKLLLPREVPEDPASLSQLFSPAATFVSPPGLPPSVPLFYQEVIRLSKEGKTQREIAEALGIGQGEVALVLNLYINNDINGGNNRTKAGIFM